MLSDVLLDEVDISVRGNASLEVELSNNISSASEDASADIELEVLEGHLLLLSVLLIEAFPRDHLVWSIDPVIGISKHVGVVLHDVYFVSW